MTFTYLSYSMQRKQTLLFHSKLILECFYHIMKLMQHITGEHMVRTWEAANRCVWRLYGYEHI